MTVEAHGTGTEPIGNRTNRETHQSIPVGQLNRSRHNPFAAELDGGPSSLRVRHVGILALAYIVRKWVHCTHRRNRMTPPKQTRPFLFGIYPGGGAGSDDGITAGPPEDPAKVLAALADLQGNLNPFLLRVYERYSDADAPSAWPRQTPPDYEQYLTETRKLDLVIMFQSKSGDVAGFLEFVRALIARHAPHLATIQITEEANFSHGPDCIDGPWPRVDEALTQGVIAARRQANSLGMEKVLIGFNATPTFGENAKFWQRIGALGGRIFLDSVDYVGLDFFPDVFRPLSVLEAGVQLVLETMRTEWMPAAGLGSHIPIHVAENGWPTSTTRTPVQQADRLERVIRTIWHLRERVGIERYTLFSLRDANSIDPKLDDDFFHHFGIMDSEYRKKPAFEVVRKLFAELGQTK
jgi:hypothetical protein